MLEGFLVRAKGGFYFVKLLDGEVVRCRARGRLKEDGVNLMVGDRVEVLLRRMGDGVIEKVMPRKSSLTRPAVANVDQAVAVVAMQEPPLDLYLLHRIMIAAAARGLGNVLCFNKLDLVTSSEHKSRLDELDAVFTGCGYRVVRTSSLTGEGLAQLQEALKGKISVLAGPSGAGKSTLLNTINPGLALRVASLSQKSGRGRHTTRHVELISLDRDTFVADTPGFQRIDLVRMPTRQLASFFPEIEELGAGCRFGSCLHHHEPDCSVKEGVEAGEIVSWRYDLYISFLEELERQESIYQ